MISKRKGREELISFTAADTSEDRVALAVANVGMTAIPECHPVLKREPLVKLPDIMAHDPIDYHFIYAIKWQHCAHPAFAKLFDVLF